MTSTQPTDKPQDQIDASVEVLPLICQFCHEHIASSPVYCKKCQQPYHNICANNSDPLKPWTCSPCGLSPTNYRRSIQSDSHSSTSSKISLSYRQQLELKRLEEERELSEKRDKVYLSKKYKILQQVDEEPLGAQQISQSEEICGMRYSAYDNAPRSSVAFSTTANMQCITSTTTLPISHVNVTSLCAPVMSSTVQQPYFNHNHTTHINNSHSQFMPNIPMQSHEQTNNTRTTHGENIQQQSFINPGQTQCYQTTPVQHVPRRNLTAEHLHARQTVPKDLPTFSGNPEEWPLFSSTYDWSTSVCGLTDAENLIRLQRALRGNALEAVEQILVHPSCVPDAISTLKILYGQPEKILYSLKNKIRLLPQVNPNKMQTLTNFAIHIKGLLSTIEACGLHDEINNSMLLQELLSKLPPYYQISWGTQKLYIQQQNKKANLFDFSNWIFELGLSASSVNFENCAPSDSSSNRKHKHAHLNTHVDSNKKKCVICSSECRNAVSCKKFLSADRKERWNIVKQLELCKHCLRKHSGVCYSKDKCCNVDGCQLKHHHLLHGQKTKPNSNCAEETSKNTTIEKEQESSTEKNLHTHNSCHPNILFKVIPIQIYGNNNKTISTYAFLDDGSSTSLIDEGILKQLDLKGEPEELCLKWTANIKRREKNSQRIIVRVSGLNNKLHFLDVHSVRELLLPRQTLDYDTLRKRFNHLEGLPIESYTEVEPKILIGLNNLNVMTSIKVKEGCAKEPIAIKTKLGWTIYGPHGNFQSRQYNLHICECSDTDNKILQIVNDFYKMESLGIGCTNVGLNKNDERALNLLEKFTKQRDDGHYETCLLWQYDNVRMPNNYDMAIKRLICLENKLMKNKELFAVFSKIIDDYIEKGYVSKIDETTPAENIWYLPIFPVFNKNKPGKCRIVWDAAAKYNGISLNSMLYKGPDLLESLPAIIFQFRERSVALCGDIEQMFHQVYMRPKDREVQRFLWRYCETDRDPDVFVMNVMIFGASCAPCISQYVKNKNASKFRNDFPQAASAVKTNHYVDDFLYSTDTVQHAIQIAKEVQFIQNHAGFNLRNWSSNKLAVVENLENVSKAAKTLNICGDGESEKVLGIFWNPVEDMIVFKISPQIWNNEIISGKKHASKRQILRILMTVYDPLGLIAHFMMYLKIILQEIWKSGVGWDEPIKEEQLIKWEKWLQYLPDLEKIKIPRCYLKLVPDYNGADLQVHTFVDASENGYAAVVYLRIEHESGVVCSLIGSKTRVAPLRMNSIPRLELMAALIGCRFANFVIKNHSIPLTKKYFWSDSKTVISWLTYNNKKYHQFVALRVCEILESTDLHEWFWIPGKLNVADEATKWAKRPDVSQNSRWFNGPDFLLKPEHDWPKSDSIPEQTDNEMRQSVLIHTKERRFVDVERFSKWSRMLRAVAYVVRFVYILKNNQIYGELTPEELLKAETILYRQAQNEFYSEEINALTCNKRLSKTSPLYKITPKLDNGIIRVDGRIDNACVSEDTKSPIVLPKNSYITHLLVMHIHTKYFHCNNETVVNEIRQHWYIPQLRTVVRKIVKQCQFCKIKNAIPVAPQMAKLPKARLAAFCSPFTYTGLDYFGPIMVTVGRHLEKRYGALFTCLTLRAVHVEVVNSLNTSSCIIAIRNFICRRGTPREFFSDNGTNFVGAEKELREAIKDVDKNEIVRNFTTSSTKWNFIPPASPHMGGAWERLVRSVKTVLYKINPCRAPSDELLRGMLIEVENIINSRPLVYVPIDTENAEALTPNHLLIGSSNGMKPLAIYDDSGTILKHTWLTSQQYADSFWRKWLKEYLPHLTCRSKWHEKAKPLEIGDLVIVVDSSSPKNVWLRGKVIETIPSMDGQVRQAKILTPKGILLRPAVKLAILDVAQKK